MEAAVGKSIATNRLIAVLPDDERDRVVADLDVVPLAIRHSIAQPRGPFTHIYFPFVIELQDRGTVEVATVGNEGMIGVPVVLGAQESPASIFCQVAGNSARMKTTRWRRPPRATTVTKSSSGCADGSS